MRLGGGRRGERRDRRLSLAGEMHNKLDALNLRRNVLSQVIARSYVEHSNLATLVAAVYTDTYLRVRWGRLPEPIVREQEVTGHVKEIYCIFAVQ